MGADGHRVYDVARPIACPSHSAGCREELTHGLMLRITLSELVRSTPRSFSS